MKLNIGGKKVEAKVVGALPITSAKKERAIGLTS